MATDAKSEGGLVFHPLDQFIVKPLFGDGPVAWYTPTNVTLWMGISVLAIILLFVVGSRGRAIIPTRIQSIGELIYGFIYKMVEDVTGKDGVKYFPYIMTLFVFILFANYLALLPMSYSATSMIAVTAVLGFGVFICVTILGFVLNVIAVIEVISYFVRPVSHSIRLAGNIMAGHAVIKVFAGFAALTWHPSLRLHHSDLCVSEGCTAPFTLSSNTHYLTSNRKEKYSWKVNSHTSAQVSQQSVPALRRRYPYGWLGASRPAGNT